MHFPVAYCLFLFPRLLCHHHVVHRAIGRTRPAQGERVEYDAVGCPHGQARRLKPGGELLRGDELGGDRLDALELADHLVGQVLVLGRGAQPDVLGGLQNAFDGVLDLGGVLGRLIAGEGRLRRRQARLRVGVGVVGGERRGPAREEVVDRLLGGVEDPLPSAPASRIPIPVHGWLGSSIVIRTISVAGPTLRLLNL